ncbi:gag/pol protein [Cucumis melo var. makuwa]|uniref:Gag/pol protein n=1 Tax=Cucumis melo var. makuwa TaxID=1194695 RepID=A0A5D3C2Q3_CUCMM|nr:gag/pol protein [Cucumis melo var. makuwa]
MEECPPFPTQNASQSIRDAYNRWTKANDKIKEGQSVREHILDMIVHFSVAEVNGVVFDENSQVSFVLKSLSKSFLQFRNNAEMNKIKYNMTTFLNKLQTFSLLRDRKKERGKGPTVAIECKGKAKVAIKGKCFHCNVDGHWKRNCPSTLLSRRKRKETNSFKQLEKGEMTLKVGMGDVISAIQ